MNKTVKTWLIFSLLIIIPIFLIKMNTNYADGKGGPKNINKNDVGKIPDQNETKESTGNNSDTNEQKNDETKDQENGNITKKGTSKGRKKGTTKEGEQNNKDKVPKKNVNSNQNTVSEVDTTVSNKPKKEGKKEEENGENQNESKTSDTQNPSANSPNNATTGEEPKKQNDQSNLQDNASNLSKKDSPNNNSSRSNNSNTTNKAGKTINFYDVAGMEEEKNLMKTIIDFLKNPQKYEKAGAHMPKGVLLYGPPGTGKTYLAKAVAGEAQVNFKAVSGTELLPHFIGGGAKKLEELFKDLKNNAPSILFIDEIDTFGGKRNDNNVKEKELLIELLTQMDGFNSKSDQNPVVVMAATNRKEVLDEALLRPGRFDYLVEVGLPDINAREAVLKLKDKNKKLSEGINLRQLAEETQGLNMAQLDSLLNTAVLIQIEKDLPSIDRQVIEEAKENLLLGLSKTTKKYNADEKRMVSLHQAGKILVNDVLQTHWMSSFSKVPHNNDKLIILTNKTQNENIANKERLLKELTVLLAGKAGENMDDDWIDKTQEDLEEAHDKADEILAILGYDLVSSKDKEEVKKEILTKCFFDAKAIIAFNQTVFNQLTDELQNNPSINKETITSLLSQQEWKKLNNDATSKINAHFYQEKEMMVLLIFLFTLTEIGFLVYLWINKKQKFSFKPKKWKNCLNIKTAIMFIVFLLWSFSLCFYHYRNIQRSEVVKPLSTIALFDKIEKHQMKNIVVITENSLLDGLHYQVLTEDKMGQLFENEMKPTLHAQMLNKIHNHKIKDFHFEEAKTFNLLNFSLKMILTISSLIFTVSILTNIKKFHLQNKMSRSE
ncbi:AAA family ATPase [Candidatus Phytoplasma pruni]|uniref:AAA family ATPase n=1 Tax=Candidatus Phytoplasma pruni TaxID=479893 RepID=A0A851HJB5_9MOLU|nr:AAA family ATPase [Candidatus Phytoplasma pruni]NWN45636.1 AAA family ATPase [Candidatus Phytoplasma pruni]